MPRAAFFASGRTPDRRRSRSRGIQGLAEEHDQKSKARTKAKDKPEPQAPMGPALRSVYQRTVEEAIPSEMLDLLAKLD